MARTGKNIYKRKDGRWEARFIFSYDETGKARYKYLYARTYKDVKNKLVKAQTTSSVLSITNTESKEQYSYWLNEWLKNKGISVKESTYIRYKNSIEKHIKPELGKYPISKISSSLIKQFTINKLENGRIDGKGGLSPKSMSDILVIIKESFRYAQSYGAEIVCSFERVNLKKTSKEIRVLSLAEEKRLLTVLLTDVDRFKIGVFICLYTGIRIGELCALQSKCISPVEKTVKIERTMQRLQNNDPNAIEKTHIIITEPKSFAAIRTIPLPDFVIQLVEPFLHTPNSYVLSGRCDSFVEPRTMQNRFKSYLKEAEIENTNFHALRHTFATRCVEAEFDIKILSEILGHSSVKITLDKYVHPTMALKRNNMEKLKLAQ